MLIGDSTGIVILFNSNRSLHSGCVFKLQPGQAATVVGSSLLGVISQQHKENKQNGAAFE